MGGSTLAIAEGISQQIDANTDSTLTTGLSVLALLPSFLDLQEAWSKTLSEDAYNIYAANASVPFDPGAVAEVASLTEKKNCDSTVSDLQTGSMDSIIQAQKTTMGSLGSNLTNVIELEDPLNSLLQLQTDLLATH